MVDDARPSFPGEGYSLSANTDPIQRLLRTMRAHLGLDIAFVAEFHEGQRVFRYLDSGLDDWAPIAVGDADPLEESFCYYVARGEVPELLVDPRAHPVTARLAATDAFPVGTHLSVPIRLSDGTLYGSFCCFSTEVRPAIDEQSLGAVRMMADVVGSYLDDYHQAHRADDERREQLRALVAGDDFHMVFQPILHLSTHPELVGVEALARFPTLGQRPDEVFADAARLGVSLELELKAVREALRQFPQLPEAAYLTVNVSPETLSSVEFLQTARSVPANRLVVEITEHTVVASYDELDAALQDLTDSGVRLAIDDVGTGISGLSHILRLNPDILKIDVDLVRDVHTRANMQALVAALVAFAARTEVTLVAEGIETADELRTLQVLGVAYGQGYHLARPAPLPELVETLRSG